MSFLRLKGPCLAATAFLLLGACGAEAEKAKNRSGASDPQTANEEEEKKEGSGDPANVEGAGSANGTANTGTAVGKSYYETTVRKIFLGTFEAENPASKPEYSCVHAGCHVEPPAFTQSTYGPLTIFNYEQAFALLNSGLNPQESDLFKKVSAQSNHLGGNRCSSGSEFTPCLELIQWWQKEFPLGRTEVIPPSTPNPMVTLSGGSIESVSVVGEVFGKAFQEGVSTAITVDFYKNGTHDGGGILVGSVATNPANQRFSYKIPAMHIDNSEHVLRAYKNVAGQKVMLGDQATSYHAYAPKRGDYYTESVSGALTAACGTCHGTRSLEDAFYKLLTPAPHDGGSRTNNEIYRKGSGALNHSAGNRCNGNNACTLLQSWWDLEFGG
jgi:hypothetical protein